MRSNACPSAPTSDLHKQPHQLRPSVPHTYSNTFIESSGSLSHYLLLYKVGKLKGPGNRASSFTFASYPSQQLPHQSLLGGLILQNASSEAYCSEWMSHLFTSWTLLDLLSSANMVPCHANCFHTCVYTQNIHARIYIPTWAHIHTHIHTQPSIHYPMANKKIAAIIIKTNTAC